MAQLHRLESASLRRARGELAAAQLFEQGANASHEPMRHMVVIVPELTGYASVRHVAVSLPYAAQLIDGVKYMLPSDMRMAAQTAPIEAGAVHLPARAPWVEEFKKERLSFPASKHDDQIDALSQALQRAFAPGPPVAVSKLRF
jgi:phage terminase large subunit-like protein